MSRDLLVSAGSRPSARATRTRAEGSTSGYQQKRPWNTGLERCPAGVCDRFCSAETCRCPPCACRTCNQYRLAARLRPTHLPTMDLTSAIVWDFTGGES
jgi:hypothetical protein